MRRLHTNPGILSTPSLSPLPFSSSSSPSPSPQIRELKSQTDVSVDSWYEVLQDLCELPMSEVTRKAFEEVLVVFPTAVVIWQR